MRASLLTLLAMVLAATTLPAQEQPIRIQPIRKQRPGTEPLPDQAALDKKALESVGLKDEDFDGMLKYLKSRTLTDVDLSRITDLIKKLGDEEFESRTTAAQELEKIGPPAIAPLKIAAKDDNTSPESQYRSREALRRMEKVPHAEIAAACARALAKAKKPEAVPTLLAYLPIADSSSVADAIRESLAAYAYADGKPSQLLLDTLTDKNPARRSAAGVALLGNGENAELLKVALPKVLAAAKAETDKAAKFDLASAVLMIGRDKAAMPLLLETMPDFTRNQVWQIEDLLVQLAGKDAPKARCIQGNRESFVKAQKAWSDWWQKSGGKIDLSKAELATRIQGRLFVLVHNYNFNAQGSMVEYGADEKERNRINGMAFPIDVSFTNDGRMWVVEQNTSSIVERDLAGKQLSTRQVQVDLPGGGRFFTQPMGVQALDDGGVFAICRNVVVLYDKKGDVKAKFTRQNTNDILAATRLKSGEYALLIQNNTPQGQKPQIMFLDKDMKEIKADDRKPIPLQVNIYQGALLESGEGKILVTEQNKITEYDIKTGKVVWEKTNVFNPRALQRLPNGNTLVLHSNPGILIELTPEGETAWTFNLGRDNSNSNIYRAVLK